MAINFTTKEIFVGACGVVIGGFLVGLLNSHFDLAVAKQAFERSTKLSEEATTASIRAEERSSVAIQRVDDNVIKADLLIKSLEAKKKLVDELESDIDKFERFSSAEASIDGFEELARSVAKKAAIEQTKIEVGNRLQYKKQLYGVFGKKCELIVGKGLEIKKIDTGNCKVNFSEPFGMTPNIQLTVGDNESGEEDRDNAANFYSVSRDGFIYQVWDLSNTKNRKDSSLVHVIVTDLN